MIKDRIVELIKEQLDIEEVDLNQNIEDQEEIDSIELLDFIMTVESEFDIEFDDDELDRFSLRDASNYTESEVNEFREVFYTILDEEKPRWIRSLQLREISIPNQMKDEVVMVINELRELKMQPA